MVLVTGASGLVGSHLLYELVSAGEMVRALIRSEESIEKIQSVFSYYTGEADELIRQVDWVYGDVTDVTSLIDTFEEVSEVYHCAAYVSFSGSALKTMKKINVEGTKHIVDICLDLGVRKLVHVSSIAAIGKTEPGKLITEEAKWPQGDISPYSRTKTDSELEIWRGLCEGLNAAIVNPSVIIGPGNWHASSGRLFSQTYKGMKFYTSGSTGFVDVRDVAKIMVNLMKSDITGERFILNAANLSYRDLFNQIAVSLGKQSPKIYAHPLLSQLAWRIEFILDKLFRREPTLTKYSARTAYTHQHYSSAKVGKNLNIKFRPIEQSVKETAELFLRDKD